MSTNDECIRDEGQRASSAACDQDCAICGDWVMSGELLLEFPTDDLCEQWLCKL